MPTHTPYIPEYITVHLGPPSSYAENVTLSFPDYIKNVASSEIYPTWNEEAIRANIFAQISFALNRVYLEFYISQGYNFNITNSTAYDQSFNNGRNIFENISQIVDEIFTSYIKREDFIEPLAAKYCNGTTVTCEGLSQWGSQELAKQGYDAFDILQYYYGYDIEIVDDAPIRGITNLYPGQPLRFGDSGESVTQIQITLNRISQDYPAIPKINPVDGIFGKQTEEAVKKFQQIFDLVADGVVGKATWNKMALMYVGIKRLAELDSEGQLLFGESLEYPDAIELGDTGEKVTILQYFLSVISQFYSNIPFVDISGTFGKETENAVIAFQQMSNLPQTGIVNDITWNDMYNAFKGIIDTVFINRDTNNIRTVPYGGEVLKIGSSGDSVKTLQQYINLISTVYLEIQPVPVTGVYDKETEDSVVQYQRQFDLPATGIVDKTVWDSIANTYKNVASAVTTRPTQFPGYTLKTGMKDEEGGK